MPNELSDWIIQHGTAYDPAICPDDIKRGPIGSCFDTSIMNALPGTYRYVEGIAFMRTNRFWALHAWLTDGKYAYDPTWRAYDNEKVEVPMPTVYIGVELDTLLVAEFMSKTGYCGVIANAWRSRKRARKILPEGIPILKW